MLMVYEVMLATLILTLFLTLTLLMSEIHMDPTTLFGTHSESGVTYGYMYFTQQESEC
jgi:hypothetical protein